MQAKAIPSPVQLPAIPASEMAPLVQSLVAMLQAMLAENAQLRQEVALLDGLLTGAVSAGGGLGAGAAIPGSLAPEVRARMTALRQKLLGDRDALYAAIRQFDAGIDPEGIGGSDGWRGR